MSDPWATTGDKWPVSSEQLNTGHSALTGQYSVLSPETSVLQVGCGSRKIRGAVTLDINPRVAPDVVWDLNEFPYPFPDSSFETVVCEHVIEHLREVISVMEELHRITKPGGRVWIRVPHFSSLNFNTDPTHVHAFSSRSFDYLCLGTELVQYDYSTVRLE